jgi:8-oxo-dGTP diphosphatase
MPRVTKARQAGRGQRAPEAVLAAGAVVVDPAGRVLLVLRGRPPNAGAWSLPGGRVETGESTESAAVREVLEETGVIARPLCGLGVVLVRGSACEYAIHEHLLVASTDAAVPKAADDAADARWVVPSDLVGLGVSEAVREVVERGVGEARTRGVIAR